MVLFTSNTAQDVITFIWNDPSERTTPINSNDLGLNR